MRPSCGPGPDDKAISFGLAPAFSYFRVLGPQEGARIRVQNPLTNGIAYVTAKDVGPSGAPPEWYLTQKNQIDDPGPDRRRGEHPQHAGRRGDNIVSQAGHNEADHVIGEVGARDGEIWYRIGQREFVHSSLVRVPSQVPAASGKLIVAELTDPCIVTAYEDGEAGLLDAVAQGDD